MEPTTAKQTADTRGNFMPDKFILCSPQPMSMRGLPHQQRHEWGWVIWILPDTTPARGHSCPQQCQTFKLLYPLFPARRSSHVAADRNVRAPGRALSRMRQTNSWTTPDFRFRFGKL